MFLHPGRRPDYGQAEAAVFLVIVLKHPSACQNANGACRPAIRLRFDSKKLPLGSSGQTGSPGCADAPAVAAAGTSAIPACRGTGAGGTPSRRGRAASCAWRNTERGERAPAGGHSGARWSQSAGRWWRSAAAARRLFQAGVGDENFLAHHEAVGFEPGVSLEHVVHGHPDPALVVCLDNGTEGVARLDLVSCLLYTSPSPRDS